MDDVTTVGGQPNSEERPEPSEQDKKLAADWLKKIQTACGRHKELFKGFEKNRRLLRGIDEQGKQLRTNLYFSELKTMLPQVYAKDPEYAVSPTPGVPDDQLAAFKLFCEAAEVLLTQYLVKGAKLKKRAKRSLIAAYTTSVGWWKLAWQEDRNVDPLLTDQMKDIQDNIQHLESLKRDLADPQAGSDEDLKLAQLQQQLAGLQSQSELKVARGLVLDFVLSEDVIIVDASVRELADYERAAAIAHRVWLTKDAFKDRFGYACSKGKAYIEKPGVGMEQSGANVDKTADLLCVYEVWDQTSNRVFTVCDGEEGFVRQPQSPEWTSKRWYPFFGLYFNEIDGSFYPLADVTLIEPLVKEYNENRDDFVRDRKEALPLVVVRKGGSLTEADVERIRTRQGGDTILVEGVGGQPLTNDIWSGALATLNPDNYSTQPARADIEQIAGGGGDAARGTVMKAKTATEAEILNQGMRSRSSERQDTMEDLLSEVGTSALQILLRKLTPEEVLEACGPKLAASWPAMSPEQIFTRMTVDVRGGSTGKPNALQEQDRWTKMLPVIKETVQQVSELRQSGQDQLADALVALARETLRRFDERIDIETYLPPPSEDGTPDPHKLMQENGVMKQKLQELGAEYEKLKAEHEKGYISAATSIATSAAPGTALFAFQQALQVLENPEMPLAMPPQAAQPMPAAPNVAEMPPQMPDDPGIEPQPALPSEPPMSPQPPQLDQPPP